MYREIVDHDENFLKNIDYRRIAVLWYYRYRGQNDRDSIVTQGTWWYPALQYNTSCNGHR